MPLVGVTSLPNADHVGEGVFLVWANAEGVFYLGETNTQMTAIPLLVGERFYFKGPAYVSASGDTSCTAMPRIPFAEGAAPGAGGGKPADGGPDMGS